MLVDCLLMEAKNLPKTMIGLLIDHKPMQSMLNEIKGILDGYDISYSSALDTGGDYHVTIAQIPGTHSKDELKRKIDEIKRSVTFKTKSIAIFQGKMIKKNFIVLEMLISSDFLEMHSSIRSSFEIVQFPHIKPHLSIFTFDERIDPTMKTELESIDIRGKYKVPVTHIALFNNKFKIEYKDKI